ncbi:MAG: hypothetical protein N2C14_14860 [Planctomycetales bacterium]
MDLQHINVKLFVDGESTFDSARFIEVFHRWIAEDALEELLIDVADYRHVPAGPEVTLVGHEADYGMERLGGRQGLRYNRKAPLDGGNESRFQQALRSAAKACQMLETEFGEELKFNRGEFELSVNDRALAPNVPETFESCKPELEAFLKTALGHEGFSLKRHNDPRGLFRVVVQTGSPLDLAALSQLG